MGAGNLSAIHDLKFPFQLNKQTSCCLQLTNKSDEYVAFNVQATEKYCVCPNVGIVVPGTTYNVTVTMQAPQAQEDMLQRKDEFLVQSVLLRDMFNKQRDQVIINLEDFKLRVIYVPLKEVPPGSEQAFKFKVTYEVPPQGSSTPSLASCVENGSRRSYWFDVVASLIFRDKSMYRNTAPLLDDTYEAAS
ncbi:hypothetical protein MKX03_020107 [Papaver bracteatum]|nr:hypothetical protein MKX03_020107 [Papaver bracteatum]